MKTEHMVEVLKGFLDKHPEIRDVLRGRPSDVLECWLDEFRSSEDPEKDAEWLKACLDWDGEGEPPVDPGLGSASGSANGAWADGSAKDNETLGWTENDWVDDSADGWVQDDGVDDPVYDSSTDHKTHGWTETDDWFDDSASQEWTADDWVNDSTKDGKTHGWSETHDWTRDFATANKSAGWSQNNWVDYSAMSKTKTDAWADKTHGWIQKGWIDESANDNKTYGHKADDWSDDSAKDNKTYGCKTGEWGDDSVKDNKTYGGKTRDWAHDSAKDGQTSMGPWMPGPMSQPPMRGPTLALAQWNGLRVMEQPMMVRPNKSMIGPRISRHFLLLSVLLQDAGIPCP